MIRRLKSCKKPVRKCCICGKPVFTDHSNHCYRCYEFARRMDQRRIHADAVKRIWGHVRRHGYVCYYTKTVLDMTNPKSPFYFVFDHMIPGDDKTIVLTFALLNEMKSDMIPKEFWYYIRQFSKFDKTGAKIRKKRITHWQRLVPKMYHGR